MTPLTLEQVFAFIPPNITRKDHAMLCEAIMLYGQQNYHSGSIDAQEMILNKRNVVATIEAKDNLIIVTPIETKIGS